MKYTTVIVNVQRYKIKKHARSTADNQTTRHSTVIYRCTARQAGNSWWRHQMETFSALLAICAGIHRSPVNSPHKGQWWWALVFSLICAWINGWVNKREAGDLRRHCAHYDVILMWCMWYMQYSTAGMTTSHCQVIHIAHNHCLNILTVQSPADQNPLTRSGTVWRAVKGTWPNQFFTLVVIRLIAPTCASFANINKKISHPGTVWHTWHPRVLIIVRREALWCWTGVKPFAQ